MKKKISMLVLAVVMVVSAGISVLAVDINVGSSAAAKDSSYTLEEMLKYALEDERMAQAEYELIMEKFDVKRPFENIAKAEEKHEEAIIRLYEAKGIKIPEFEAERHVVIPNTIEEVYSISIDTEVKNIKMYENFLKQDIDDDVRMLFTALKKASENHLKSFERVGDSGAMARNGGVQQGKGAGERINGLNCEFGCDGTQRNLQLNNTGNMQGRGVNRQNNSQCILNNQ